MYRSLKETVSTWWSFLICRPDTSLRPDTIFGSLVYRSGPSLWPDYSHNSFALGSILPRAGSAMIGSDRFLIAFVERITQLVRRTCFFSVFLNPFNINCLTIFLYCFLLSFYEIKIGCCISKFVVVT